MARAETEGGLGRPDYAGVYPTKAGWQAPCSGSPAQGPCLVGRQWLPLGGLCQGCGLCTGAMS